jgi:serine protease Do
MPGGPGEKAGLQQGDLVISIDGKDVNDRRFLYEALRNREPGQNINLKVLRNNRVHQLEIPSIRAEDYFA